MEYQALPPVDVAMASTADVVVAELNDALGKGHKNPWKVKVPAKTKAQRRRHQHGAGRARFARSVQRSGERHVLHARPRLAVRHLAVAERHGLSGQGRRRRIGLGPGPVGRLGARAARPGPLRDLDARRRRFLHGRDRDLERGASPHPAARSGEQQSLLFQRRTASGERGAHPRPRGEEPLDRPAAGRSDARTSPSSPRRRARSASGR